MTHPRKQKTNLPFVSVIIPVYNDLERLRLCLDALENQTYSAERYEVVVVDNNSDEAVAPHVQDYPHVRVLVETIKGSDASRNCGLANTTADYLAFTDADCIPRPDWLETGIQTLLNHPHVGLVGGEVDVFTSDAPPTSGELYEQIYAFPIERYIYKDHFMPTCNMFTFRSMFERVGEFAIDIPEGGDLEWGQRVHAAGYELFYCPETRVSHPARHLPDLLQKHLRLAKIGAMIDLADETRFSVLNRLWFYKLFYLLPPPRDIRKTFRSSFNLLQKLRVLSVITLLRSIRTYEYGVQISRKMLNRPDHDVTSSKFA